MTTFAYPKKEHLTLPSVSDWYSNTNILRDPPRAIVTRRIDKVGQTSDITEIVDSSTDRACESIRVYAKGVNPMVSVSYDNQSNNAGIAGNSTSTSARTQASLPFKAMNNGAFRPPIRGPRDLLPLSRLPRVWFQTMSAPCFTDYSKSKYCPTKFRVIRDLLHAYDIKPNKSAKLEKPILENFKMENAINDKHINIEGNAGTAARDITSFTRDNVDIYKGISDNIIEAWANTNVSQNRSHNLDGLSIDEDQYVHPIQTYEANSNMSQNRLHGLDGMSIDEEQYVHEDILKGSTSTNRSQNRSHNLENISIETGKYIQNLPQYEKKSGVNTGVTFLGEMAAPVQERLLPVYKMDSSSSDSRVYKVIKHENDPHLRRNLPQTGAKATVTKLEDFNSINMSSREYKLNPTLRKESFENKGVIPKVLTTVPQQRSGSLDKDYIRRSVNDQQFDRYSPANL